MFRYRLEPLLRWRKSQEEEQQRRLAAANRAWLERTGMIHDLETRRESVRGELATELAAVNDANVLQLYDLFFSGSERDIALTTLDAMQAQEVVEMERGKLVEAVKQRKIIETHRTRLEERYRQEEERKERIALDEIAIMRHQHGDIAHA